MGATGSKAMKALALVAALFLAAASRTVAAAESDVPPKQVFVTQLQTGGAHQR